MSLSHSAQDCEVYSHAHSLILSHSVVLTHSHTHDHMLMLLLMCDQRNSRPHADSLQDSLSQPYCLTVSLPLYDSITILLSSSLSCHPPAFSLALCSLLTLCRRLTQLLQRLTRPLQVRMTGAAPSPYTRMTLTRSLGSRGLQAIGSMLPCLL